MELEELRAKRIEMEKVIYLKIREFEDETGVKIESVDLIRSFSALAGQHQSLSGIDTTVRL